MPLSPTVKLLKSTDGTTIYADAVGNPANPSIVFTHGFALSAAVFNTLFENPRLLEKFYLVTPHSLGARCLLLTLVFHSRYDMICVVMEGAENQTPQKVTRPPFTQTISLL
jgi:hypothetical protein